MSQPLYAQVAQYVRMRIESGEYAQGSRIPPEHELAKLLRVSRPTVRQALAALARELEQLLACKRGAYRIYPSCTNFLYVAAPDAGLVFERLKARGIIVRRLGSHLRITAGSEAENAALVAALDGILD